MENSFLELERNFNKSEKLNLNLQMRIDNLTAKIDLFGTQRSEDLKEYQRKGSRLVFRIGLPAGLAGIGVGILTAGLIKNEPALSVVGAVFMAGGATVGVIFYFDDLKTLPKKL